MMNGTPDRANNLLISILNWNGLDDTLACIESIAPYDRADWHVLVIDNGSTTDPRPVLQQRFPHVECIRIESNLGFAGGQNIGMQAAIDRGYESVLLLNNDCEISADAVSELIAHIRADDAVAAVSPLIYCTENRQKPQLVAGWFDWPMHRAARPSSPDISTPDGYATMLPGTVLMLRCAALKTIGLLDPRYFAYYEDNDLSARIARSGFKADFCKKALAWHSSRPVHEYSAMALYLSARNARIFWSENTPAEWRRGLWRHLLAQSLYEIVQLKKAGATAKCKAVSAGFWDGLRGRSGRPPVSMRSPWIINAALYHAPYFVYNFLNRK